MKRLVLLLTIALALTLALPAWAAAPSADLQQHAPASSKVLIGVNVPAVRQSFLFKDMLDLIRAQPANKDVLGFVLNSGFIDIEKDVDGLLIATPATTLPNQAGQPLPKQDVALLVRGRMDKEKAVAAAKAKYGKVSETKRGKRTIWDTGEFKFTFVDDKTLVLVAAGDDFTRATWEAIDDSKKSIAKSKEMKGVVSRIKTASGIWMASTQPPSSGGAMPAAPVENMAMSVDIAGRLRIDMKSETKTEESAKQMAEQLEALKKDSQKSPMVQALGAGPLLGNLQVSAKGKRVDMSTRMTNSEFKAMFERVKALQGGAAGMPAAGPGSQPTMAPTPTTGEEQDGANADFN